MNRLRYPPLSYNQMFGLLVGGVYVAVGLAGFASTAGVAFAGPEGGRELHFFSVNPLHNIVHAAVGAAFMVAALAGPVASRAVNLAIAAVYLALAVAGPFLVGTDANILGLNLADHLLHLGTGLAGLLVVTVVARRDELGGGRRRERDRATVEVAA